MKKALLVTLLCSFIGTLRAEELFESKIGSIYIAESFINEQLEEHIANSDLIRNLKVKLDSGSQKLLLHGDFILPLDDIRAVGIDKQLADFKFQLSILPKISPNKHLVLEFPISETYFYQANSKHPVRDRVVIPVQLLSLGLAATRGYLAALSGDFSTFDRKAAKNRALLNGVNKLLQSEKNPDAIESLKNEKKSLELNLASVELERVRFARTAKSLNTIFAFSGEKDLNLNNEIKAYKNVVILKLKLSKLVPYLKDIELGGIRTGSIKADLKDQNYLIFDINTMVTKKPKIVKRPRYKPVQKGVPPALMIRLSQNLFTSKLVVEKEKEKMSKDIKDFQILFQEDGIHIKGKVKKFFMDIPFDGLVDFVSTGPDVFEVRLRELEVLRMDFKFLTPLALTAIKSRLKKALNGIGTYKYLGDKDHSRVLQVRIDPKKLIPAFPDFHLVGVDVRDRNFMLKIGRVKQDHP
jgi:hypothetical protein